jgi:hypothetical protein
MIAISGLIAAEWAAGSVIRFAFVAVRVADGVGLKGATAGKPDCCRLGFTLRSTGFIQQIRLISTIRLSPLSFGTPDSYNRPLSSLPRPLRP